MSAHATTRMSEAERRELDERGYVVRETALTRDEVEAVAQSCEEIADRLARDSAAAERPRLQMGSYVFEIAGPHHAAIKWENDARDTMLGVEPVAHLDPALEKLAADPRLVDPMKDVVGADEVALYTEKLNLKRAGTGGPIVLHQDHPYWVGVADDPLRIGTAMLFLDATDRHNGCLEVAPGSHRRGVQPGRGGDGFGANEMDPTAFADEDLVALEVPAGSVAFFGPLLVHRSGNNPTAGDRRALLLSYQPAGARHQREFVRIGPEGVRIRPSDA